MATGTDAGSRPIRVLLVDDDEDDYLIVRDLLAEDGDQPRYALTWLTGFDAAVEALQRDDHDVCLVDYRLGLYNGLDLVRAARQQGWRKPIILLTGQGDDAIDRKAMAAGATDYLEKAKLDARSLGRAIRYAVANLRAQQALGESEERYRVLLGEIDEIVYAVDFDPRDPFAGTVRFVSSRVHALLGYRPEDFTDDPGLWFRLLHPDDAALLTRQTEELVRERRPVTRLYRLKHGDSGEYRWMEDRAAPRLDARGEIVGIAGVARDITDRRHADRKTRVLASALEQTDDAVLITDRAGVIEYVNPAYERTSGYRRDEVLGGKPSVVKSDRHDQAFYRNLWGTILADGVFRDVLVNRRKDGTLYYEQKTITPLKDEAGNITHFVSTGKDITDQRQAEQALRERDARIRRMMESNIIGILFWDASGAISDANDAFLRMIGYSRAELEQGKLRWTELTPPEYRARDERALAEIARDGQCTPFEKEYLRKDGGRVPVLLAAAAFEGTPDQGVCFVLDLSQLKHAEERLSYLAYYDTLTGLANRRSLTDNLRLAMAEADRIGRLVAVALLDLDRFKIINDTLGHNVGDQLLQEVAERLKTSVRAGDTVARLGGDEFAVVLGSVAQADDIAGVAQKIIEQFAPPFHPAGRELFVTPSIGIALYPSDADTPETLLKNADAAMYHAKESGRNAFRFYTAELNERAGKRLALETALRQALARGELLLHYQPLVDMGSGKIIGTEALIRWRHPELGLVPPLDFIPLAEDTGLIVPIGEWVLNTACAQTKAWQRAGFQNLQMAVNLSLRQFHEGALAETVRRALADSGLEPRCLDLELTESMLMRDPERTVAVMQELKRLGVSFSMDDFGTGYSSLSYLKRFPLDTLKIDRSFVRDITTDPNDAAITQATIVMAKSLGLTVIAEGVETKEQLVFLKRHGCDAAQGYYFSRPLPPEELGELLAKPVRAVRRGSGRGGSETRAIRGPRRRASKK